MEDVHLRVGDDWTHPKPIMCVNIPDHYEFVKTDSEGKPLTGVKFRLEDEEGTELALPSPERSSRSSSMRTTPFRKACGS